MKYTYKVPEITVAKFEKENVLTLSATYSDPTKTTQENVNNYILKNDLNNDANIMLEW